jgi:acetolactate synthase-1/2/3 large subunit
MQLCLSAINKKPLLEKTDWLMWCKKRKEKYPVVLDHYWQIADLVNPYCFIDALCKQLPENQIIVTANATACIVAFQAFKIKTGQRLYSNSGSASMGYDLPAAIGACVASGKRQIICLAGDGSVQLNIQELATIRYYQLPIKIFVLNNNGYHSIRQTQNNYFSLPYVGVCKDSGLFFPQLEKIAAAYEMAYVCCHNHAEMESCIRTTLAIDRPIICEIMVTPDQPFSPKVSSIRSADGRMISRPLEDLAPFLNRDELADNMLIDLLPEE